ncbi:hypothetical protein BBAD15_m00014 (mitochondrion) [Beauveria bassiana D1-5]|uniref:Uncharacterized protein n=1 Tax=Beauveria bassiana D1-5 TaxID=1245745 RepID=A0A0A2VMZ8_BEABA|nr:hypothetical protein BBAD15_m00014 [Beauveria bassiana D1-5]
MKNKNKGFSYIFNQFPSSLKIFHQNLSLVTVKLQRVFSSN